MSYKSFGSSHVIISLYVDDLLIFGTDMNVIESTKALLKNNFDMKDMGKANVILGMFVTKLKDGIFLDQSHHVEKILKKFNYFDCTPVSTLLDPHVHLLPAENSDDVINQIEYARIIGSLRYAADTSRPDIAHAVGVLSKFTHKPTYAHWFALSHFM